MQELSSPHHPRWLFPHCHSSVRDGYIWLLELEKVLLAFHGVEEARYRVVKFARNCSVAGLRGGQGNGAPAMPSLGQT